MQLRCVHGAPPAPPKCLVCLCLFIEVATTSAREPDGAATVGSWEPSSARWEWDETRPSGARISLARTLHMLYVTGM